MAPLCSLTLRAWLSCYETKSSYTEAVIATWKALVGKIHNEFALQTVQKLKPISIRACHSVHHSLYVFLTDSWLVSWFGYDLKRERKIVLKVGRHQLEVFNYTLCVVLNSHCLILTLVTLHREFQGSCRHRLFHMWDLEVLEPFSRAYF